MGGGPELEPTTGTEVVVAHPPNPSSFRVFRVRGIPKTWDGERVELFFKEMDEDGSSYGTDATTLATEADGQYLTSTVTFRRVPPSLRSLQPKPNEKYSFRLPTATRGDRPQVISVDNHFFGITTLFAPPAEDHKVDIVAICGLNGHAFGSFKQRGGDYMWLRDALPYDIKSPETGKPMARIMTYGYESAIEDSINNQTWEDIAGSFYSSLLSVAESSRPIIFIAHSLGGLIVKQTLIILSNSAKPEPKRLHKQVYGVAFFGVPHAGMDTRSLIPMVGDQPNRSLVDSIGPISQLLVEQRRLFKPALGEEGQAEVFCFYETLKSKTAVKNSNGKWVMEGVEEWLVDKTSATHCRPWEDGAEHMCAIVRSHQDLIKFGYPDEEYDKVRNRLQGLCQRALSKQSRIQGGRAKFVIPYARNKNFEDRPSIMESLTVRHFGHAAPTGSERLKSSVCLLGEDDSGKTEIAKEYAYRLRDSFPNLSVFWIDARSINRLRESLHNLARVCEIPGHDDFSADLLVALADWLNREENSPGLVIYDGVTEELFTDILTNRQSEPINETTFRRLTTKCPHAMLFTTASDELGDALATSGGPIRVTPRRNHTEELAAYNAEFLFGPENPVPDEDELNDQLKNFGNRIWALFLDRHSSAGMFPSNPTAASSARQAASANARAFARMRQNRRRGPMN